MRVPSRSAAPLGMQVESFVEKPNYENVHSITVNAPPERVWAAAERAVANLAPTGLAAVPLAAASVLRRERPRLRGERGLRFEEGARVGYGGNSFEVAAIEAPRELVLTGRHRYADFATNLFLELLDGGRTRVWNVTRARFRAAGLGRVYRAGVGVFHDPYVEAALRRIKRLAERGEAPAERG